MAELLEHHGRPGTVEHLRPLYDEPGGCLTRALWFLLTFPFRLVFKLVAKLFKTLLFFLAARDAALQVGRAALLGRAVDQSLRAGRLPAPAGAAGPGEPCWVASARLRRAFDQAFAGSDWRLLREVTAGVLRGAKGLGRLALAAARRRTGPPGAEPASADGAHLGPAAEADRARLDGLAASLRTALDQPEAASFLDAFDQRLAAAWAEAAASPPD